ncbi:MAG: hypothetical protein Q9163_004455, partial [Psora crenata]
MATVEASVGGSIYVAPLQVRKDRSGGSNSKDLAQPQTSSGLPLNTAIHQLAGHLTPPMTPDEPVASFKRHGDFNTYLRAFYPYHPSLEEQSSTVTLPLNNGDVILVHSIHTNGWADGTLLTSGARGWLPTNFCEGYFNEPISSLLKALTVFWDLVKSSSKEDMSLFRTSEYVRGLVAGVRYLLVGGSMRAHPPPAGWLKADHHSPPQERTQCLRRECALVVSHLGIRRSRRALLSDLSAFVKVTKAVESALNGTNENGPNGIDLHELVLKAFKTVTRAVSFLDVWEEHMQSMTTGSSAKMVPPTPPADRSDFGNLVEAENLGSGSTTRHTPIATTNDAKDHHNRQASPPPPYSRASQSYVRPGSSRTCRQSLTQLSREEGSCQVSHRVSSVVHPGSLNLASEKLGALHNTFLTYLGYFIGLHIQSRSSSELLLTTKQAVLACRDLLDLISEIWDRDRRRSHTLGEARDDMYKKITELAEAARDIFRPLRSEEADVLVPSDGKALVDAATACVRTAGGCVAECRFIIDRIGDFNPPPPQGLGIT